MPHSTRRLVSPIGYLAAIAMTVVLTGGCQAKPAVSADKPTPVYDSQTGKLKELLSDHNGDGRAEVRAIMDGTRLQRIEIDRDGDSKPDRWEYYDSSAGSTVGAGKALIVRAEESSRPDGPISRREFFVDGIVDRVEDDTNGDGRIDKWEQYADGVIARVDLDLAGHGFADRRLVYGASGNVDRVEEDPDGDGTFEPLKPRGESGRANPSTPR